MDVGLHACIVPVHKSLGRKEEKYAIFFLTLIDKYWSWVEIFMGQDNAFLNAIDNDLKGLVHKSKRSYNVHNIL